MATASSLKKSLILLFERKDRHEWFLCLASLWGGHIAILLCNWDLHSVWKDFRVLTTETHLKNNAFFDILSSTTSLISQFYPKIWDLAYRSFLVHLLTSSIYLLFPLEVKYLGSWVWWMAYFEMRVGHFDHLRFLGSRAVSGCHCVFVLAREKGASIENMLP